MTKICFHSFHVWLIMVVAVSFGKSTFVLPDDIQTTSMIHRHEDSICLLWGNPVETANCFQQFLMLPLLPVSLSFLKAQLQLQKSRFCSHFLSPLMSHPCLSGLDMLCPSRLILPSVCIRSQLNSFCPVPLHNRECLQVGLRYLVNALGGRELLFVVPESAWHFNGIAVPLMQSRVLLL